MRATFAALLALAALAARTPARDAAAIRRRAVASAARQVGHRYAGDCSGFVLGVYGAAGVPLHLAPARSRSEALFRATRRTRAPRPGDLAFFHDTYDRDGDGRADDPFTHVALVEAIDGRRYTLVHVMGRTVVRSAMDLGHPGARRANDPVRARRRSDPAGTRRLAGELFAGFGALPLR